MSGLTLSSNARRHSFASAPSVWILLAVWFTVVLWLGYNRFLVAPQGMPPVALLVAATTPVMLFLLAVSWSPAVREFALTVDVKVATAVQAWRLGGYMFLILYSYGYLPGYFAWPAAIGDMFIGATAPLLLSKINRAGFLQSRTFVVWNVLGILDLVIAVGMGALGSLLVDNPAGVFPTTIMSQLPLVLVPAFFVPVFVVLHVIALLKAKQQRNN
jgi:hypothetical protein